MTLPDCLAIYFDGSAEPSNPGGWATYGWIIYAGETEIQCGKGVAAPKGHKNATNNYAEWCALGFALRWLHDQGWKGRLEIYGDSNLVVNQLTEEWKCNAPHLKLLRKRCWELLEGIDYSTTWIPRERNARCDELAREAYVEASGETYPERDKPVKQQSFFSEFMNPVEVLPGDVDAAAARRRHKRG